MSHDDFPQGLSVRVRPTQPTAEEFPNHELDLPMHWELASSLIFSSVSSWMGGWATSFLFK